MIYLDLDMEPIDQGSDVWWVLLLPRVCNSEIFRALIRALEADGLKLLGLQTNDEEEPDIFQAVMQDKDGTHRLTMFNVSDAPRLYLGTYADYFLPPESTAAKGYADSFIELAKILYEVLRPTYAFSEDLNTYVDEDDIHSGTLRRFFWAQILGPDLVSKVGQSLLLEAPAWRKEVLVDGGILLTFAAAPFLYQGANQSWDQARSYFSKELSTSLSWGDRME